MLKVIRNKEFITIDEKDLLKTDLFFDFVNENEIKVKEPTLKTKKK